MKLLFENWRGYLKEQEKTFPYQIYCDMDGVLVDFMKGTLAAINKSFNMPETRASSKTLSKLFRKIFDIEGGAVPEVGPEDIGMPGQVDASKKIALIRRYMYKLIADDPEHWANLPPMPDAMQLWNYISRYNPNILTAPMDKGSEKGKTWWIINNLNPAPKEIFMSHDKFKWAVDQNGRPNVLIDDFEINVKPWRAKGGIAILHTSAEKTIYELEALLNETPI